MYTIKTCRIQVVRRFKEEHILGPFTNEIKYIAEKNNIKIKKYNEK